MATATSNVRIETNLQVAQKDLAQAMGKAGYTESDERTVLEADILALARRVAELCDTSDIRIRLERVETNSCRKFHTDYVPARLITTYTGSGTQWLEVEYANRVADGLEPRRINGLSTGDVGLFTGRLHTQGNPAIHRSPPIEGTGETRLLLVIDPLFEESGRNAL